MAEPQAIPRGERLPGRMRGINPFGFDRAVMAQRIGQLGGSVHERALMGVLAGRGIIRSESLAGVSALSQLRASDLSSTVSRRRLSSALAEYSQLMVHEHTAEGRVVSHEEGRDFAQRELARAVLFSEASASEHAGNLHNLLLGTVLNEGEDVFVSPVSSLIAFAGEARLAAHRSLRRSFQILAEAADVEIVSSPSRFFHQRSSERAAASARTLRMQRALFLLAGEVTGRDEFQRIRNDWMLDGTGNVPRDAQKVFRGLLEADERVLDELAENMDAEFAAISRDDGLNYDRRNVSERERRFMRDVGMLCRAVRYSRAAEAHAAIISDAEALGRLEQLAEEFRQIQREQGRRNSSLDASLDAIQRVVGSTRALRETESANTREQENFRLRMERPWLTEAERGQLETGEQARLAEVNRLSREQTTEIANNIRATVLHLNDYFSENTTTKWGVRTFNIVALTVALLTLTYRAVMVTSILGTLGPVAAVGAGVLFAAEVFYGGLIVLNLASNIRLLFATNGANGNSHNQAVPRGVSTDPYKRPPMCELIITVDEPLGAIGPGTRSHTRSAMQAGPESSVVFVHYTTQPTRQSIMAGIQGIEVDSANMVSRADIFRQVLEHLGVNRTAAWDLANLMSWEYTEWDDVECRYFAAARLAGIARDYNVDQRLVVALGHRLGRRIITDNEGAGVNDRFLATTLTRDELAQILRDLGVETQKIMPLAAALHAGIQHELNRSRISKSFAGIMRGARISERERNALAAAINAEFGGTHDQALAIIARIQADHAIIAQTCRAIAPHQQFNFTRQPSARDVFHRVCRATAVIARGDKRFAWVEDGLHQKLIQVIEHNLFVIEEGTGLGLRIFGRIPVVGGMFRFALSKRIGRVLAERIGDSDDFWDGVSRTAEAAEAEGGGSYEAAFAAAWENRTRMIRRIVEQVCRENGIEDAEAINRIADATISRFAESLRFKRLSAESSMNCILRQLQDPARTTDEIVGAICGDLGQEQGSVREVMLTLLFRDRTVGISSALGTPAERRIRRICAEVGDPVANRETLVARLQRECRMSEEVAQRFALVYGEIFVATYGELRAAVDVARRLLASGHIAAEVFGDEVSGGTLHLGAAGEISVDLSAETGVRRRVARQVKNAGNVTYDGGAKGGVANSAIKGGTNDERVAATLRDTVAIMIRERIFGERVMSPAIITAIDTRVTGAIPALLPANVPAEARDPHVIAAGLAADLFPVDIEGRERAPLEIDAAVDRQIERMQMFGHTNEAAVRRELTRIATEIAMRIDFTAVAEELAQMSRSNGIVRGNRGDVRVVVEQVVARRNWGGRRLDVQREMERWGFDLKQAFLDGIIEDAGNPGQMALRLTAAAARDVRRENILFRHYSRALAGFQQASRMTFSPIPAGQTIDIETIPENTRQAIDELLDIDLPNGARRIGVDELYTLAVNATLTGRNLEETAAALYAACGVAEDTAFNEEMRGRLLGAARLLRRDIWTSRTNVVAELVGELRSGQRNPERYAAIVRAHLDGAHDLNMAETERAHIASAQGANAIGGPVEIFAELGIKLDDGAIEVGRSAADGSWFAIRQGARVSVRDHAQGRLFIEEFYHRVIFTRPMTAQQLAERCIAMTRMPNVTETREVLATSIRDGAAHLDAAYSQVEAEVRAAQVERAGTGFDKERAWREAAKQAIDLVGARVAAAGGRDWFAEFGLLPASPLEYVFMHLDDADYRVYEDVLVDIAPYLLEHPSQFMVGQRQFGRNYLDTTSERAYQVGSQVAMAFQSGGNAYWNQTNKDNSLDSLVPSWGSCIAYSGRAYMETAYWTTRGYYKSRLDRAFRFYNTTRVARTFGKIKYDGKFSFTKVCHSAFENTLAGIYQRDPNAWFWPPALRALAVPAGLVPRGLDLVYSLTILQVSDFLQRYASRGYLPLVFQSPLDWVFGRDTEFSRMEWALRWWGSGREATAWAGEGMASAWNGVNRVRRDVVGAALNSGRERTRDFALAGFREAGLGGVFNLEAESLVEFFQRPMREDVLIRKGQIGAGFAKDNLHGLLAVQDTTTESEDIASCVWYLRSMGFFDDEAQSWFTAAWRDLFDPHPLWSSSYLEGIGPLGAHSDDLRGAMVTYYARWSRGNLALMGDVLHTPLGFNRKLKYFSLSAFWMTGFFRVALVGSPMLFLMGNQSPIAFGEAAEPAGDLLAGALGVIDPTQTLFTPEIFVPLVAANFALSMSAFLLNMWSAGYLTWENRQETLGCIFLDWGGLSRMLQSVNEGALWGERPAFIPSPKEIVYPVKMPLRTMTTEYGLAALNLGLFTAAGLYAFDVPFQVDAALGTNLVDSPLGWNWTDVAPAAFWNGFHGAVGAAALSSLNRGVHREMPYISAQDEFVAYLRRGKPTYQTMQNAADERRRLDRIALESVRGDIIWSEEGSPRYRSARPVIAEEDYAITN